MATQTEPQSFALQKPGLHASADLLGLYLTIGAVCISFLAAIFLPEGFGLALIGDTIQVGLMGLATLLALRNTIRNESQLRIFWMLLFFGCAIWLSSLVIWSIYELVLQQPVPDAPIVDILLFVKLVPLTLAAAIQPHKEHDSRVRAFGLLDLSILIIYSLYLFAFFVYAYRLIPGATETYNYHFNVADAVGNQLFAIVAAFSFFQEHSSWRKFLKIFFLAAAGYSLASDLSNVAIDAGKYYTGSLYDVPLVAAMAGFAWLGFSGGQLSSRRPSSQENGEIVPDTPQQLTFFSTHLAMLVTFSTPAIGLWLLTANSSNHALFSFRLDITLVTIFLMTLLLSIKQDFLSVRLFGSLQHLSRTYSSIDRFRDHLVQSEKLTSLGSMVASVANQIKDAMSLILVQASQITGQESAQPRSRSMAEKIAQYANRTDALVENMLRFAQETPLKLEPVEVRPLLESALHLSRASKSPNLTVHLDVDVECPAVLADSSQLMHVFLQLIENAMEALVGKEVAEIYIAIRPCGDRVCIEFADNGPGICQPQRIFEPFFTTKAVGKGTGLGLSTCYGIVQQHDGQISYSDRPGGGALFTIYLPVAQNTLAVSAETATLLGEVTR